MTAWAVQRLGLASAESYPRLSSVQKDPSLLEDNELLRAVLLDFAADFSDWDNSGNQYFIKTTKAISEAAQRALNNEAGSLPLVVDPFAGGGAIPLEALRVGADSFASDLNPLPILLNKVQQEYAPVLGDRLAEQFLHSAEDILQQLKLLTEPYYKLPSNTEIPLVYFWARTLTCEGPACGYRYPLVKSNWIKQKAKNGVAISFYADPSSRSVRVKLVSGNSGQKAERGTTSLGAATCPVCGYTTPVEQVRIQLKERNGGTLDAQLIAVACRDPQSKSKLYREPNEYDIECYSRSLEEYTELLEEVDGTVATIPRESLNHLRGFFNVVLYGMERWGDLFNPRQALLLVHLSRLIRAEHVRLSKESKELADGVATCLALVSGKLAQYNSACCRWKPTGETLVDMFGRQALPMVWDFVEAYPFGGSTGDYWEYVLSFHRGLQVLARDIHHSGTVVQASATHHPLPDDVADVFFTDPPYYAAIPYADLSDFFYVWLRRTLTDVHIALFENELSPKDEELVSLSHRAAMYRNKDKNWFEQQMTVACSEGRRITKPNGIGVFVFANKETDGWEAMLNALVSSGWTVTGSWPIDTEMSSRLRAQNSAALASSVHLVCRPRENPDGTLRGEDVGDWRNVLQQLPERIHDWMPRLAEEGVVGADAIFACLGPALEIFSKHSRVEKTDGTVVPLSDFLEQVWAAVSKEALNMVFKGADASGFEEDARLTAMWLWTIAAGSGINGDDGEDENPISSSGYSLEFDAARKIAQGLGAHMEEMPHLVDIDGDQARLLAVSERTKHLFGKDDDPVSARRRKNGQQTDFFAELEEIDEATRPDVGAIPKVGETVLDRVHQSMILFAAGRSEALKRFIVEEGAGGDRRFWSLAQALSALYPANTDEKRWVDGVLARKKSLGF